MIKVLITGANSYIGTSFRTSTIENVYALKGYTRRPKDITDIQKLKPFIDKQKLEALKQHPNQNIEIHDVKSVSNPSFKR